MGDESPNQRDGTQDQQDHSPKRRDVLRAGAAAGVLGVAGLTMNGASAQETTPAGGGPGIFSYSLEEGDTFRVRFRPREPFGGPATETVPAGCLGDGPEEYQVVIVRGFRDGVNLGFRGVLAPQAVIETETPQTTTPGGEQTTTPGGMAETTTVAGVPEIQVGQWYRVTSSSRCDGLYRLSVETTEPPETTVMTETTTAEDTTTE